MHRSHVLVLLALLPTFAVGQAAVADDKPTVRSHLPLRTVPPAPDRPLTKGPAFFVDARKGDDPKAAAGFFAAYRSSQAFAGSKTWYAPGFDSQSLVAEPKFVKADLDWKVANDYRPQPGSPVIDAGVELPGDWPDPLRNQDKGKPDIGALPLGAAPFRVGRSAAPRP